MTEAEYWRIFEMIRNDIAATVKSHHGYMTIFRLRRSDPSIQQKISKFPEFWTTTSFSLQTTFFISLGRLFDDGRNNLSLPKLAKATVENKGMFSKSALRRRQRQNISLRGDELTQSFSQAWEPAYSDLEALQAAVKPFAQKFKAVYEPIRNQIYGHRSMKDETVVYQLFNKALLDDVEEIMSFVHTFHWAIWELAWNGKKPDLTDFSSYKSHVDVLTGEFERFIRQLA